MKSFELTQVFFSVFASALFGIILGGLRGAISDLLFYLKRILFVPIELLSGHQAPKKNHNISRGLAAHLGDFLFFTITGVLYILLCYITLDGVPRLYMLAIALASYFLSNKTLGKFFNKLLSFVSGAVYRIEFWVLFPIFKPLGIALKWALRPVGFLLKKMKLASAERRTEREIQKKERQLCEMIKEALTLN